MAVSFLKKGAEAHKSLAQEELKQETRKQNQATQRFYIGKGDTNSRIITFLDGRVDKDGLLEAVSFHQHQLELNGSWQNWFVCTADQEPCPICEMTVKGKRVYAQWVAAFTIIDHTEYKSKDGTKTYANQKRLFVCKQDTFKLLQKRAAKQGGLAGCTFDVTRVGDKSEGVGSDFDFVTKRTGAELLKQYPTLKPEDLQAFDYDKVIQYHTAQDLRKLGLGSGTPSLGSEDTSALNESTPDTTDYSKQL